MKECSTWHSISNRRVRTFMRRVAGHQTWLWGEQTVVDITGALSTNVCTVDTENTAVADMPRYLSYSGPACPFIPLNICLRWSTDGTLVLRALSITHERTTVPWQSWGHSGLWGQQETTLAAKGSSSAATVCVADNLLSLHRTLSSFSLDKRTRAVWPWDRR